MRQITLLLMAFVVAYGFSQQTVLQDFEDGGLGSTFGEAGASLAPDPETSGARGQVLKLESNVNGTVWQGVNIDFFASPNYSVDLTTDKTMTLDVYSTTPITIAPKVIQGDGAPDSTASVSHTGSGWETLTVTFNEGLDGTTTADGIYGAFVIYLNWDSNAGNFGTQDDRIFYVDEISGVAFETDPPLEDISTPATDPTEADADVLSIFNDDYTIVWTPDYSFGEVSFVEIADNETIKMDFSVAGWGQGTNDVVDISQYDRVHFDYYVDDRFEPGEFGEQVLFVLIDNEGGVTEYNYELTLDGTKDGTLQLGSWVSVDIPLSFFEDKGFNKSFFFQYKLGTSSDLYSKIVYFDNIYFSSDEPLSTNSFESNQFSAYPNPTLDNWNIKSSNTNIQNVEIFNTLGRLVKEVSANNSEVVIDASDLSSGIYFAKIYNDSNQNNTIKLIKR